MEGLYMLFTILTRNTVSEAYTLDFTIRYPLRHPMAIFRLQADPKAPSLICE